ncbi:hypothetical protein FEM01_03955 [Pseudomonas mosselii]|uniref:Uncharacterized protein n=1 Tax=Pseudomonas mosselii TaxID=78327 RepID=A0A5R8ZIF4_9PSED|nr:hypothetical protein FEM01_03955 [Pseudomonas mosselii]
MAELNGASLYMGCLLV